MSTIWKFPVQMTASQEIEAPIGWVPLHLERQGDTLCLWAQVDPSANRFPFKVEIYGTGHSLQHPLDRYCHVGTVIDGAFVWHVYAQVKL